MQFGRYLARYYAWICDCPVMIDLKIISGPAVGKVYNIRDSARIGRGAGCDVCIEDPVMSSEHALLRIEGDKIILQDLGSTNGTYVNGAEISAVTLNDGAEFTVGESVCRISVQVTTAAAVSAPVQKTKKKPSHLKAIAIILVVSVIAAVVTVLFSRPGHGNDGKTASSGKTVVERLTLGPMAGRVKACIDSGDMRSLRSELAGWLLKRQEGSGPSFRQSITRLVDDKDYAHVLVQHEIIRACDEFTIRDIASTPNGKDFLVRFFSDRDWMESMLCSGPLQADKTIRNLHLIWLYDKECLDPFYKKLATSMALVGAAPYRLVTRFQTIKQEHKEMLLHDDFDNLEPWIMRFAVDLSYTEPGHKFHMNDRNYRREDYGGACWSCEYLGHNSYGDSVQTPLYYRPWEYAYNVPERSRKVGGVCGALSTFGAFSAKVHGVPATTAGQPGHCAYMVRKGPDDWYISFYVAWPTFPHQVFWQSGETYVYLMEDVYADTAAVLRACRHTWQAHLMEDQVVPTISINYPIRYASYLGTWGKVPDFKTMTPTSTGTCSSISLADQAPVPDGYGLVYEGEFVTGSEGQFAMATTSDDGSKLYVDGELLVNNDGPHGMIRVEGIALLKSGTHQFRLEFFEGGGGEGLVMDYAGRAARISEECVTAYDLATAARPMHYGVWQDYGDWLKRQTNVQDQVYRQLGQRIAKSMINHQQAAWQLIHDYAAQPLSKVLSAQEMTDYLLKCHDVLRDTSARKFARYPYDGILNWQKNMLGKDEDLQIMFCKRLLNIHSGKASYFKDTLSWTREQFSSSPERSKKFVQLLKEVFQDNGDEIGSDAMRKTIIEGIQASSGKGDIDSFHIYSDLAAEMLSLTLSDKSLNEGLLKNYPKFEDFPGKVLSEKGLLQVSTTCGYDTPVSYRDVIRKVEGGGFFHTNSEENPWAIVKLPAKGKVSGIVIVNRWEGSQGRQVPLHVSLSTDGKTWQEVYTSDKAKDVWRVVLDTPVEAGYVKVEVKHPEGKRDYFHVRNILVYGEPLY